VRALRIGFAGLALLGLARTWEAREAQELEPGMRHLGNDRTADWTESPVEPEGGELERVFPAPARAHESLLELAQRSVDNAWWIELNGVRVAQLERGTPLEVHHYPIPGGVLRDGENRLRVHGERPTDDIAVGRMRLHAATLRETLDLAPVTVRVRDAADGAPLPARVTVLDERGERARLYLATRELTAVRPGLCYQADGEARFEVPRGRYRVYATRGMEWSMAEAELSTEDGAAALELALARQVDTRGFVAVDTHVHTFTHSGHGDSTVEERQVTLAGEGVELAIATDHNHQTDYRPAQAQLGLTRWYTPVVGNEVTTDIGHFNAFPLDPQGPVPPWDSTDVEVVVAGIRAAGAEVVILNHPRWPDGDKAPFAAARLDRGTGASLTTHPYDALELVNSDSREPDPLGLFRDWFALLDRGEELVAVASSDSHHVDVMVGGGRTYVESESDDPAALDVPALARALRAGRSSLAMGIFVDVRVDGARSGDLVPRAQRHRVELTVRAPAWVRPRRAEVWVDGAPAASAELADAPAGPFERTLEFELAPRAHDAWLVCIVHGDGVRHAAWPLLNDYTLGATNPVRLDGDGDGRYSAPRATARALLERHGDEPATLARLVGEVDEAVALQALELAHEAWARAADRRLEQAAGDPGDDRARLRAWLEARR
jgi:hypothetical protein